MNIPKLKTFQPSYWTLILLPLILWGAVWIGLQGGIFEQILNSDSLKLFIQRLRSVFPIAAALTALAIMVIQYLRSKYGGFHILGPLAFTIAYGLVGIVSLAFSPDASISVFWMLTYISVPVVLLGVAIGPEALERISLLINANWIIAICSLILLLVLAFSFLNFSSQFLTPHELLECRYRATIPGESWYLLSNGALRPTGAGRIAAIGAIISLSYIWSGRFRYFWVFMLLAGCLILLTSGARTSFVGFTGAVIFIVLMHERIRGLIALGVLAVALLPFIIFTELDNKFADYCLGSSYTSGTSLLKDEFKPPTGFTAYLEQFSLPPEIKLEPTSDILKNKSNNGSTEKESTNTENESTNTKEIHSKRTAGVKTTSADTLSSEVQVESALTNPDTKANLNLKPETVENRELAKIEPIIQDPLENLSLPGIGKVDNPVFKLSGRTVVWKQAIKSLKDSPVVGFGFQGDRLILGTHMHNTYLHAVFQTGLIGLFFFVTALVLTAVLLIRIISRISWLPDLHQRGVILTGGILVFFSARSLPESSGAFFGIDWLLIAPLLIYIQLVNKRYISDRVHTNPADSESTI